MVHVALKFGEHPEVAYALPFSVDGMLVVASVVMVDDKRRNNRVRPIARLAFAAGVLASVAANIAAAHPSIGARIVAAWPAVALLLVVEMLARPPIPAAAEVPPESAAQPRPAAEVVAPPAFAQAPAHLPPPTVRPQPAGAEPAAEVARQPPPPAVTAHLRHPADVESISTAAHVSSTVDLREDGESAPSVATGGRPSQPAAPVPPPGVVPLEETEVVPPHAAARGRAERAPMLARSGARQAEDAATAVERGRRVEPSVRQGAARRRRPAATTRQLARQIIDTEPHLSRTEVAARLGVSTRRLREVLATSG